MALYIVSTPIGNLEDITLRALKVLFSVPMILCEDTRRTGNLLEWYRRNLEFRIQNLEFRMSDNKRRENKEASVTEEEEEPEQLGKQKPKLVSFHDYNEQQRIPEVMEWLKQGLDMALVSDAGTPLVSDPGFKLVRRCLEEKVRVISIPGATAWLASLTSSGMPTDRVLFLGYLSPRAVRRRKELHQLKEALSGLRKSPTLVMYEAPHRLVTTLKDILEVAGNVEMVLASELTKLHEKVEKKSVSLWMAELSQQKKIRGEYTVLFRWDRF